MYELRIRNMPTGFYRQLQRGRCAVQHTVASNACRTTRRFATASHSDELRRFADALERSMANSLRFLKKGSLLKSDTLSVSKHVFDYLLTQGVTRRWADGWSRISSMCLRPVTQRYYRSSGRHIAIKQHTFRVRLREKAPIEFHDGQTRRKSSKAYYFSYEFMTNEYFDEFIE